MPSLRKLALHPTSILPKVGKDLMVYSTSVASPNPDLTSDLSTSHMFTSMDSSGSLDSNFSDSGGLSDSSFSSPPARKRERLDHLSQEEKVMRRKIKNRVAAQSARDRKKAKMSELEDQVIQLETQKKYLLLENCKLRNQNSKLEEENAELRLRLTSTDVLKTEVKDGEEEAPRKDVESHENMDVGESFEYAEGTGSALSYSLDDAIRLLTGGSETDALLDILQQCSSEFWQCDFTNSELKGEEGAQPELPDEEMVGTTSKGLEPVKELIHFDHIYHKQDGDCLAEHITSDIEPEVIELETSELNSDDFILTSQNLLVQAHPVLDSEKIPVIHIEDDEPSTPIESLPITNGSLHTPSVPFPEQENIPSPSSSDAGYDSSFSTLSPSSDTYGTTSCSFANEDPWDETFTELFPSLA